MIRIEPRDGRAGRRCRRERSWCNERWINLGILHSRKTADGSGAKVRGGHLEDVFDALPVLEPAVGVDQFDGDADQSWTDVAGVAGGSRAAGGSGLGARAG